MKVGNIFELLGLTVVAAIIIDVVTSSKTAGTVTAGGKAWSETLRSAQGK